ncbi:MAG: hypothetical protein JWM11_7785 [Planctomycetaceae bacterium]|nr:hypothetical protein [Planctomycetaceae bacterium]
MTPEARSNWRGGWGYFPKHSALVARSVRSVASRSRRQGRSACRRQEVCRRPSFLRLRPVQEWTLKPARRPRLASLTAPLQLAGLFLLRSNPGILYLFSIFNMGQYFAAVNTDKKEFVCPWCIGGGAKLWEWAANPTGAIFTLLLRKSDEVAVETITAIAGAAMRAVPFTFPSVQLSDAGPEIVWPSSETMTLHISGNSSMMRRRFVTSAKS